MPGSIAHKDVKFGHFELQPAARQLLVGGQPAKLGARSFDLLVALVERRERVVSKDELLDLVWPGMVVEENNLQVHISALRKLFGPPVISTIPGRGYRFTALLDTDASAPAAQPVPHNLPQPRTRFIGREAALAQCASLLEETRLLTLSGMGGCGKTRLALQLVQHQLAAFADGVWFVDLAPLQEPQRVALAVAAVLGVREETGQPLIERLASHLAPRRNTLLVLDNCEHVLDAVAEVADALLVSCAGVKIVATSRERLGVAGEQLFAVQPLLLAPADDTDALQGCEAVRLFIDRARLALPGFEPGAPDLQSIGDICRRLDGIALAIELAAARVKMLSVCEIGARLGDRFRLLTGGSRTLPRHQTLQATLQWSHDSLAPPQQRLLRELAVFAGGCTLAAAAQVADTADDHAVLELLGHLHDKSLLVVDRDGPAQPRYRMLETVRQYAQQRLEEAGDGDAVRDRHLAYYVALAGEARQQIEGPQQGACMARLRLEQENLLAAHARCEQAAGGGEAGLRLAASLWRYWVASAQLERGHRLAQAALERAGERADPLWRCRTMWALGQLAFRSGRYEETLQIGGRCLALARSIGSAEAVAAGLVMRAGGLLATGRIALALPEFESACDAARPLGASFVRIAALHGLAEAQRASGHLAAAERCYEESIEVARVLQDPRAIALPLCNLAGLLVATGQLERVAPLLLESLALATAAGLKGAGEHLLEVSAGLAATQGDHPRAAYFSGAAAACMHEAGSQREPMHEAFVAPLVARAQQALGRAAFDSAKAAGQALGYEAAMAELKQWLEQPTA